MSGIKFESAKPCEVGISAKFIKKYVSLLEKYELSTHNVIMIRGNKIFFEKYWEPFNADFAHRMYSISKSFVSLAIGFLLEDGLISLDDKIVKYFPKETDCYIIENVRNQTIRNMLMMSNGYIFWRRYFFDVKPDDRVKMYFEASEEPVDPMKEVSRKGGTFFEYDSNGSFIMGAMVERVTGKTLIEYLNEKLFSKIGVTSAKMFTCPGGHAWSDSALICTPLDLAKSARFVMNYGKVNGEQILSEDYLRKATARQIDNCIDGVCSFDKQGYGYQFWRTWQNSFFFNGMGCQLGVCVPEKDLILIYNGDNQGNNNSKNIIIDRFFEEIVDNISDEPVFNDEIEQKALEEYCKDLKLYFLKGEKTSAFAEKVNGKTYHLNKNKMGISKIKFTFEKDEGYIEYTNAQGDKKLPFGLGKNVFCLFPEEGYSRDVATVSAKGNFYKCASSGAWSEEHRFNIAVQVIDEYFGRLYMSFCFIDENTLAINFTKFAEDFFREYHGYADGIAE